MASQFRGGRRVRAFSRPVAEAPNAVRPYAVVAVLMLAATFQSALSPNLRLAGVAPDFALIFLAAWAAVARPRFILLWGFLAGFLLDMLNGAAIGTNMLALTLACYVASMGGLGLFRTNLIWALMAVLLATVVYYPIAMILLATHGFKIDWADAIGAKLFAALLVNLIAGVVLYWPITVLERVTRARRPYRLY